MISTSQILKYTICFSCSLYWNVYNLSITTINVLLPCSVASTNALCIEHGFFSFQCCYRNPSLGLATKVRACKVAGQEGNPGVKKSVREWTFTLLREPPLGELESMLIPESLESNYKGQNPMDWGVFNTIGKAFGT